MRPLKTPATRNEKSLFWDSDLESIVDDAKSRINDNGRGAYGTVDSNLPKDISELTDDDK